MAAEGTSINGRYLSAILLAAVLAATPFINLDEGNSLHSYPDAGGVWTACHGVAYVIPNHRYTAAECKEMDAAAKMKTGEAVIAGLKVPLTVTTLEAHIRFAYNVGPHNYRISRTLRLTNAGRIAEGCRAMAGFHRAGGKDCRLHKSGCYGMINRRAREISQCLEGVK